MTAAIKPARVRALWMVNVRPQNAAHLIPVTQNLTAIPVFDFICLMFSLFIVFLAFLILGLSLSFISGLFPFTDFSYD